METSENPFTTITNVFRQFKLGNSILTAQVKINTEFYNKQSEDFKNHQRYDIVQRIAEFIYNNHPSSIKENQITPFEAEIKCELLVMKPEDFKTIVEAVIVTLTDEQIKTIKNGKSIESIIKE